MEKNLSSKVGKKEKILILVILFLGLFLRTYRINQLPPGLSSNEALVGFRALSLIQTGKDETGRNWPLIFTSFKDYQLPFTTYYLIPFVRLFGLSEYSARLPFVLLGELSILFFYLLVRNIFLGNNKVILWSTLFFAINPWGVFFSRLNSPEISSLCSIIIGIYFLVKSKKIVQVFLSSFILAISFYSTKSSWIFLPIFLTLQFIFSRNTPLSVSRKNIIVSLVSVLIISFPITYSYFRLPAAKQSCLENDLSFFSDTGIINGINQMRGDEILFGNKFLGKFFYNKTIIILKLVENFSRHFTPRFFFASGDQNPLHGFSNFGPIFSSLFPLVVVGIFFMIKKEKKYFFLLLLFWVSAVFSSVFTFRNPDQSRYIFSFPVIVIFAGYAMNFLSKKMTKVFFLILIFNILFLTYDVSFKEPQRTEKIWGNDIRNINFNYFKEFDKVYFTDAFNPDPAPQLLFYSKFSPRTYQEQLSLKSLTYRNWINVYEKIQIGQPEKIKIVPGEKILLIISPQEEKNIFSAYKTENKEIKEKTQICYKRLGNEKTVFMNKVHDYLVSSLSYDNCLLN